MDGTGAIEWKQQSGFRKGKISISICNFKLDHEEVYHDDMNNVINPFGRLMCFLLASQCGRS